MQIYTGFIYRGPQLVGEMRGRDPTRSRRDGILAEAPQLARRADAVRTFIAAWPDEATRTRIGASDRTA